MKQHDNEHQFKTTTDRAAPPAQGARRASDGAAPLACPCEEQSCGCSSQGEAEGERRSCCASSSPGEGRLKAGSESANRSGLGFEGRMFFRFTRWPVMGVYARLAGTWLDVRADRAWPAAATKLVGQMLIAAALQVSAADKGGKVSMRLVGKGEWLELASVAASGDGTCRAALSVDDAKAFDPDKEVAGLAGQGAKMTVDYRYENGETFRMEVPVTAGGLEGALTWRLRSDRRPDKLFRLAANEEVAAGLMLMFAPNMAVDGGVEAELDAFGRDAKSLSDAALLGPRPKDVLRDLFFRDRLDFDKPEPFVFGCDCNRKTMGWAVKRMGQEAAREAIRKDGVVTARCPYCSKSYSFGADDLLSLFAESSPSSN